QTGEDTFDFPRGLMKEDTFDFSFSGLKSAVINKLHNCNQKGIEVNKNDVAASFQASVTDVLTAKTFAALKKYDVENLIIAGGVAGNSELRSRFTAMCEKNNINLQIPQLKFCTDNAAMIGAAAYHLYVRNHLADLTLNGRNFIDIEEYAF